MKRMLLDASKAAGDMYSPVIMSPSAIARRASSPATLCKVADLCSKLESDQYTKYVTEFYSWDRVERAYLNLLAAAV